MLKMKMMIVKFGEWSSNGRACQPHWFPPALCESWVMDGRFFNDPMDSTPSIGWWGFQHGRALGVFVRGVVWRLIAKRGPIIGGRQKLSQRQFYVKIFVFWLWLFINPIEKYIEIPSTSCDNIPLYMISHEFSIDTPLIYQPYIADIYSWYIMIYLP